MVDVNPGTFSWGVIIMIHAKEEITASTNRNQKLLQLIYNPLIPRSTKFGHLVFGGFHAELRVGSDETHTSSRINRMRFYHLGGQFSLPHDTDDTVQEIPGSNSLRYIQWRSAYYRTMEAIIELKTGATYAAGEPVCALLLGNFGQPGFVFARRDYSDAVTHEGKSAVGFYRIIKDLDGINVQMAPSYDTASRHMSRSHENGWTVDEAYATATISIERQRIYLYGLFFYKVLRDPSDNDRIELFKIATGFFDWTHGVAASEQLWQFVSVFPSNGDPHPITDTTTNPYTSQPETHGSFQVYFDVAYNAATQFNTGPRSASGLQTVAIHPNRGVSGSNINDSRFTMNTYQYKMDVVSVRYGDMIGAFSIFTDAANTFCHSCDNKDQSLNFNLYVQIFPWKHPHERKRYIIRVPTSHSLNDHSKGWTSHVDIHPAHGGFMDSSRNELFLACDRGHIGISFTIMNCSSSFTICLMYL